MIQCPICSIEYTNRRIFSRHLSTTHKDIFDNDLDKEKVLVHTLYGANTVDQCVDDYKAEKWCIHTLPINVGRYISLLGIKRTSSEERKTSRYKAVYLNGIQRIFGEDITNISQVKSVQDKKESKYSQKHGSYEKYLEHKRELMMPGYVLYNSNKDKKEKTLSKQIATYITKYGVDNPAKHPDIRKKMGIVSRDFCALLTKDELRERTSAARAAVCHRGGFSSKPEKRVRKILVDLDIEHETNKHLWHYNWDMVIDKILIEVQGTMWHAKPDRYKSNDIIMGKLLVQDIWDKDARKYKKAIEEGFAVIYIWEDEISARNDDELYILVKERLTNNGYNV